MRTTGPAYMHSDGSLSNFSLMGACCSVPSECCYRQMMGKWFYGETVDRFLFKHATLLFNASKI